MADVSVWRIYKICLICQVQPVAQYVKDGADRTENIHVQDDNVIKYYSHLRISVVMENLKMSQTWKWRLQTFDGWKNNTYPWHHNLTLNNKFLDHTNLQMISKYFEKTQEMAN